MFHFTANLKPYNVFRGTGNERFDSYLLSVDYLREHQDLATLIVAEGRILCADNGNVDLIGRFIARHRSAVEPLHTARKAEERSLGHKARPGQLSAALTTQFREFAAGLLASAQHETTADHTASVVRMQESMQPHYLVGMEDFTLVALTALGIEREYSNLPLDWYAASSLRAIEYAQRTKAGDFGPCRSLVFGGLHAVDYDTASQAGRLAAKGGLDGIASGLVGAMQDKTFVDFRVEHGAVIDLPASVPRPYLRTLEIITGFHLGYADTAGRRPRFHGLGVGSPILLPMIALLGDAQTYLAVDSTAPIKDAMARTIALYVDTPAPRKLKAFRIAEYWLSDGLAWLCPCPYCRSFRQRHPDDPARARAWWKANGERRLGAADMLAPSPLAECFPLLCASSDSATNLEARAARISHNHWVLKRIETDLRRRGDKRAALTSFVTGLTETFLGLPGSDENWRAAAELAWQLASSAAGELASLVPDKQTTATTPGPKRQPSQETVMPNTSLPSLALSEQTEDYLLPAALAPAAYTHFFKTLRAAQASDWLLCRRLALAALGQGHGFVREQLRNGQGLHTQVQRLRMLLAAFPGSARSDFSEHADNSPLKEALLDRVADLSQAMTTIDTEAATDTLVVAHLSRALQVLLHAEFNLACAKWQGQPETDFTEAWLRQRMTDVQNQLLQQQLALYGSCAAQEIQSAVARATALAAVVEQAVPEFVRVLGMATVEMERRLAKSQGSAAEQLGALLCTAGALVREAIASHAAAHQLALSLATAGPHSELAKLYVSAPDIAFSVRLGDGRNTEIAKVGKATDGDHVEVRGRVEKSVAGRTRDGKLVSRLTLRDPSSGKSVLAVALFAHLPHAGVTPGTFCRLHGIYRKQSVLAENTQAIEIDRLAETSLAGKSWHIALLRSARPWFSRWRNGSHLDWTLTPHRAPSEAGSAPLQGANEIIFSPLIRS